LVVAAVVGGDLFAEPGVFGAGFVSG